MQVGRFGKIVVAAIAAGAVLFGGSSVAMAAESAPQAEVATARSVTYDATDIGIYAQGGFDRDHWWIKISKAEAVSIGVNVVCRAVFRGPAGNVICPPIVAAVNWAISQFPNAGGFWAELYTNGTVRVGTW